MWPVLLSTSETDLYCSTVVNYSFSLLVFHYVNVPQCIILLFMGTWVVSMSISSIPSGEHLHSFLFANLPGSELSKSKGYAYVQPE